MLKLKRGDSRPDGKLFWRYCTYKGERCEYWVTPEKYACKIEIERRRQNRFHNKNPNYTCPSWEDSVNRDREYRAKNPDKVKERWKRWADKNRGYLRTRDTIRRVNVGVMSEDQRQACFDFYNLAKFLSDYNGIKYHVDHYLPIYPKHKKYTGLSFPWNLQVIPAWLNYAKSNNCPLYQ